MFHPSISLMLYVSDVQKEKAFWQTIGFTILSESEEMGYTSFDMTPTPNSDITITVYDKAFIQTISPEVADNKPSLLLYSDDLDNLHKHIKKTSNYTVSQISEVPFQHFTFETPNGDYITVRSHN